MISNAFFFHTIFEIGGVETMFYEMAKKYHNDYEIVVFYCKANEKQLRRLKKYVKCVKYINQVVECKNAFFNYNLEPFISNVKAECKYEIIHADFKKQSNIKPQIDVRIDKYIAVSENNAKSFEELTGIKCEVCPNPLSSNDVDYAPLFLCVAQRMTAEKGGNRIKALVESLDACMDIKYYMLIFTSGTRQILSENVSYMPTRLDVRHFINACDLFVALSDCEGRCYSVAEKLNSGHGKLLITPCPSFFEQGASKDNSIVLNFDLSNIDDVINEIRKLYKSNKLKKTFNPKEVVDCWDKYLIPSKSTYEGLKYYKVKATNIYRKYNVFDNQLKCCPKENTTMVVDGDRLGTLLKWKDGALVEVIEEIK